MKIFIYGGSFNPPHCPHREAVNYLLRAFPEALVYVIPCRERTGKRGLSPFTDRLEMCRLAFADLDRHRVIIDDSGEMVVIDILRRYREQFPAAEIYFVVGYDLVRLNAEGISEMHRYWTDGARLWRETPLLVFPRGDSDVAELRRKLPPNMLVVDFRPGAISGTAVRQCVATGGALEELVPPAVAQYIRDRDLYQTESEVHCEVNSPV